MMNETQSGNLFYRDGHQFTGKPQFTETGKTVTYRQDPCHRCGGAGGADKWAHTGWTCFECGGGKLGPIVEVPLYTAEKLAKLNAAQEKRATKKAAEQAAAAAELERERTTKRGAFTETHKEFFAQAATLGDVFVDTMIAQCIQRAAISEKQIELINNKLAERARKAGSAHVGMVGQRQEFSCKVEKYFDKSYTYGFRKVTKYFFIMRDEQGNAIKYVGGSWLGGVVWEGDRHDGYMKPTGETIKFKATVEEHSEYNGEKQTVVNRPKLIEEQPPTGTKGGPGEPWL